MEEAKKVPTKEEVRKEATRTIPVKREKIISGTATVKKKSLRQKILETFIPGDIRDVKTFAWNEIIIPAFRRTLDEFISQGAHQLLYPGDTSRRDRRYDSSIRAYYDYNRQYRSSSREPDRGRPQNRWADDFDLERVSFSTRTDAEMVLSSMENVLADYPFVRVSDFFDFAGISTDNYQTYNYGWTSLREAGVHRDINGDWYIHFPRVMPID